MKTLAFILLTLAFFSGCCLGGPDITYFCDSTDYSVLTFDNSVTYDKVTITDIQLNEKNDTLFIAYKKGAGQITMDLYFYQASNSKLTFDSEKSEIKYIDSNSSRNSYRFISQSVEIQEFEDSACCQENSCEQPTPDSFKGTISGQVQFENQIKDINIIIDIITTETEHREC